MTVKNQSLYKQAPCNLAGLSVLVTRPEQQANELCLAIEKARGRPVRFPTIEILGPADKQAVRAELANLAHYDLIVFISSNAVRYAFPLMPANIPLDLRVAAIGAATAQALQEVGLDPTLLPDGEMNSEGLLALPQLQDVAGQRILIVRGNEGRETLRQTLQQRGATVSYCEVYRRRIPQRNPSHLIRQWDQMVEVVTISSAQILENLIKMLGETGLERLRKTPLVVVSTRIAELADAQGCEVIYLSQSPMDADVVRTLCEVSRELF